MKEWEYDESDFDSDGSNNGDRTGGESGGQGGDQTGEPGKEGEGGDQAQGQAPRREKLPIRRPKMMFGTPKIKIKKGAQSGGNGQNVDKPEGQHGGPKVKVKKVKEK